MMSMTSQPQKPAPLPPVPPLPPQQPPPPQPMSECLLARPQDSSPMRSPCLHRLMHIDSSGSSDSESCGQSPKRGPSLETKDVPVPPVPPGPVPPLNLDYIEEDKPLVTGGTVRAATVAKLASMAVNCFSHENGDILEECSEFPRVLLLMHQWFITSENLAEKFMDLYNTASNHATCNNPGCSHKFKLPKCGHQQFRMKVCYLFRYWIATFPMHFDLNPRLSRCIQRFQDMMESSGDPHLPQLLDISKVPSYDWMRNMSVRNPNLSRRGKHVNLLFNSLPPQELADQLTFLEYKAFRRITFTDFKNYAVQASLKDNPKLERSIALFNGLSQWVQCMVLSKTTPQQRAEIIVKFVNVAKRLRQHQNFNTLMAVVGGLTHSALARLSKTNSCIPADTQKVLGEMTELLSSSTNFSNYRRALQQCEGFRIPILGVHLKDLVLLNTALHDKVEGVLINFRKMAQLSITFTELMLLQNSSLPVEPNMDLVNMIRLSLDLHYTEDEIYELSLAREPRNSLSSPSTPTKPVVFADWIAGVSPPDPNTINKHVNDMVEAVFKNYDHDKDGFISHTEFELIAGNFPFIDSFCVLDADQDGMISKSEMKTYFIRANCHALRNSFKHDFHEQTYFRPTFCIHCTGLLWGIIKQGWKCKDCNIHAHKHCKDLVVMECRPKSHSEHLGGHSNKRSSMSNGSRDVTMASKRKMSQRHRRTTFSRGTQTDMDCGDCVLEHSASIDRGSLDRSSLDQCSFDRSSFDRGSLDRGSIGMGSIDRGSIDRGSIDRGSIDRGSVDRIPLERGTLNRGSLDRGFFDRTNIDRTNPSRGSLDRGHIDRGGSFDQGTIERGGSERGSLDRGILERSILEKATGIKAGFIRGRLERASSDRTTHEQAIADRAVGESSSYEKGHNFEISARQSHSFDQSLVSNDAGENTTMNDTSKVGDNESDKNQGSSGSGNSSLGARSSTNGSLGALSSVSSSPKLGPKSDTNSPKLSIKAAADTSNWTEPSGGHSTSAASQDTEFYEEQSTLYERMLKAEEERDKVILENKGLKVHCDQQTEQISALKSQLGLIRQHTITFILDQMDTLHMQRDTEV